MGTDFERNALAGLRHFSKSAIVKWDDIAEGIGSMTDSRELLTPRDLDL